jgi:Fe2+ or Zn2+ uptake regulation protein
VSPRSPKSPGRGKSRPLAEYSERLRREARRLTGPRQAILARLRAAEHPLSSKEIHASLPGHECNLVTVYRSLHLLERLELVQRFDLGDGVARYELRHPGGPDHHHHLVCRRCAKVIELEECDLAEFERRVAAHSGFARVSHRLEFFGFCPTCQ